MAFSLSRNANLFVSTVASGVDKDENNTWEIKVLDGFSFTAATDTQEIEINEAGATPTRGQQVFTTAIQPAEWSLQAYIRPRYNSTDDEVDAVERILWEGLSSNDTAITTGDSGTGTNLASNPNGGMTIDFTNNNTNELKLLYFYWNLGTATAPVWYYMPGAVVNQAEIDFAIDAIASITWSGFADSVSEITDSAELAQLDLMLLGGIDYGAFPPGATDGFLAAPTGQQACIRNKLSTVSLTADANQGALSGSYAIALTGGTLTINNNITFLTPEALGVVNQPCGHFTGQFQVSGNMTAYLKTGAAGDTADLLNDLLQYSTAGNTGNNAASDPTRFALDIYIGGGTSDTSSPFENPIVHVQLPAAHLVIPTINIEDVVSVDIPFTGLAYATDGTTPDPTRGNEINLAYYAAE